MSNKDKLLASAQKYLQKGQVARAVKDYQKLVELEPRDVRLRQKLAELYSRDQRTDEAMEAYESVAKHYTESGFYLKAIAVFKQMQKIDPSRVSIYHRLAELNEKQGLVGNAQIEYRSLVAHYEKAGMLPEASNVLQKMKELEPENLNIRVKVAETFARAGLKEKAFEEFHEILGLLRHKRDFPRIVKLYELFLPHFPDETELLIGHAEALIEQGDIDRGLAALQELERKHPGQPEILLALAHGYRKRGDAEKERTTYRQLLEVGPGDLDSRAGYILVCLEQGDLKGALVELEAWKEAFIEAGKVQLLKDGYERLAAAGLDDERVLNTLRSIYELTGEGDKLLRVIETMPTAGNDYNAQATSSAPEDLLETLILQQAVENLDGAEPRAASFSDSEGGIAVETVEPNAELTAEEVPLDFLEGLHEPAAAVPEAGAVEASAEEVREPGASEEELELELELNLDLEEELDAGDDVDQLSLAAADPVAPVGAAESALELAENLGLVLDEPTSIELLEEMELVLEDEIAPQPLDDGPDVVSEWSWEQELEPTMETSSEASAESEGYVDLTAELVDDVATILDGVGAGDSGALLPDERLAGEVGAVVEEIDPEDAESHYNLGIAYKEMGLIDDAIVEFDRAAHNPGRALDALTLKGLCLLDKGAYAEAEGILRSGLDALPLSRAEATGLRFELGLLYQAWGRPAQALEAFEAVAAEDAFYRNVGEKVAALREELGRGSDGGAKSGKKDRVSYV